MGDDLSPTYKGWVDEILTSGELAREGKWTESVAVGNKQVIDVAREKLGSGAAGRDIRKSGTSYELREPGVSYSYDFGVKNGTLSPENTFSWGFYS